MHLAYTADGNELLAHGRGTSRPCSSRGELSDELVELAIASVLGVATRGL